MPLPWLPALFPVNPWQADTFDNLYLIFRAGFVDCQASYNGLPVWIFPEREDGKEKIFWHLTSRDQDGERLPDLRRCERLPWSRPILDNHHLGMEVLAWDYDEGHGVTKTYVWLQNYDFVVIMKKYPDATRRLITSFWLEYENTKRKMRKKYQNRIM